MNSQRWGAVDGRKDEKVAVPMSKQPCGRQEGDDRVNVVPAGSTVVLASLGLL